jgi:hypothetical protein
MHDPEVSGQTVLVQVVVGKVQDFQNGESSEPARKADQTVHRQVQDSGKKRKKVNIFLLSDNSCL